ncbi:MAG: Txe/YoeB family addiction module toxin [Methanomassiliicoccaceae archaeon]|nr:Txe/YoeB family addiction module toxin [Methanomassiliicoccaceae archaeon]
MYEMVLVPKAKGELERSGYGRKARKLLSILEEDPFRSPPKYKRLGGNMKGLFSRRISVEHRIVYEVMPPIDDRYQGRVKVHRMRTHYKGIIPVLFFP